jgi:hypothetical protein
MTGLESANKVCTKPIQEPPMKVPLLDIAIPSIYFKGSTRQMLPSRMAKCTPDMYSAIYRLAQQVASQGGALYLSDLFRSHDMQLQAHLDWKSGKKSAFSPAPGGSMHEAGRAFDLDLGALKISLKAFWHLAQQAGVSPIISKPDAKLSEAWHFDCPGSHARVYSYYKDGKGNNFAKPYTAMAASAINAVGITLDMFGDRQREISLQFGLIRLGYELGNVDGVIGKDTREAMEQAGLSTSSPLDDQVEAVEDLLQRMFPNEYEVPPAQPLSEGFAWPDHLIA